MLILTRRSNESVIIGSNIEVKVLEVKGNQVSLGFTAPREISIYRKEVYEAIERENIQAAARGKPAVEKLKESLGTGMTEELRSTEESEVRSQNEEAGKKM